MKSITFDRFEEIGTPPGTPLVWVDNGQPFDRKDPARPHYLIRMRWAGARRGVIHHPSVKWSQCTYRPKYGGALRNALNCLPKSRGLFLDAGCGNSPDADMSKELKFKRAVKVDLFPPDDSLFYRWSFARFIQGDICNLDELVEPGSVDMIACSAVLDLMPYDDRVLFYRAAAKSLAEGGILSITYVWLTRGYHDWNEWKERKALRDAGLELVKEGCCYMIYKKV